MGVRVVTCSVGTKDLAALSMIFPSGAVTAESTHRGSEVPNSVKVTCHSASLADRELLSVVLLADEADGGGVSGAALLFRSLSHIFS